jgi:Xaa-Pro aminopeptidase
MDYPARRRQQLVQSLPEEGLDLLLISNPINVTYLTGFSGESSYLLVSPSRALLVSDGRFTQQLAEECPGLDVIIRPPQQPLAQAVAATLNQFGGRSVGFESNHLTIAEREQLGGLTPSLEWKGGYERVERLRAVKDPSEIEQIREAIAIAERAFGMFRAMLRARDTEKELSDALEMYIRRAGGKCSSFPSIVAVGERSALPHAPPTNRAVDEAELLLVDWGAGGPFYKSDLTRVLLPRKNRSFSQLAGRERLDSKLETIYAVVRAAQERAIAAVRPGVPAREVDAAARGVITEAGYGPYFTHGLGHGIGLQVHEAPALRASSTDVLEPGMVVTIEPGIYLPGWGGIRLEDDVLVTPDGCEVLTSVSKEIADCTLQIAD